MAANSMNVIDGMNGGTLIFVLLFVNDTFFAGKNNFR